MRLEEQITETLKRSCKTDCEEMLNYIPGSLIIGCCLESIPGRKEIYKDSKEQEYAVVVSKRKNSPKYKVRLVKILDII